MASFSCGLWNLVPWPRIEPEVPALGAWSLSHWTVREVPPDMTYFQSSQFLGRESQFPFYRWGNWCTEKVAPGPRWQCMSPETRPVWPGSLLLLPRACLVEYILHTFQHLPKERGDQRVAVAPFEARQGRLSGGPLSRKERQGDWHWLVFGSVLVICSQNTSFWQEEDACSY